MTSAVAMPCPLAYARRDFGVGIHHLAGGTPVTLHADIARMMAFDSEGRALAGQVAA